MDNVDTSIINFKNLKPEDKIIIQAEMNILEIITAAKDEYREDIRSKNTLTKMMYESAIEATDEIENKVRTSIIMTMADMIRGYEHVPPAQNTDNCFYGLERVNNEQTV